MGKETGACNGTTCGCGGRPGCGSPGEAGRMRRQNGAAQTLLGSRRMEAVECDLPAKESHGQEEAPGGGAGTPSALQRAAPLGEVRISRSSELWAWGIVPQCQSLRNRVKWCVHLLGLRCVPETGCHEQQNPGLWTPGGWSPRSGCQQGGFGAASPRLRMGAISLSLHRAGEREGGRGREPGQQAGSLVFFLWGH